MKQRIIFLLLALLVVPFGLVMLLSSSAPFAPTEPMPLRPPKPEPREGYELIYSRTGNGNINYDSFYYVSNKRQVIYRYDSNRYLELQGENCSGLIWYHDDKNNVHTRITERYFTAYNLPQFKYFNPGEAYIAIPTNDLSDFVFSIDGGQHFVKAVVSPFGAVPGDEVDYYIGVDGAPIETEYRDGYDNALRKPIMAPITISGNTGYFILKNGEILFGASHLYNKVYYDLRVSTGIPQRYSSLSVLQNPQIMDAENLFGVFKPIFENAEYQAHIASIKQIKPEPYQGWDKIRCEVGAEK